MDNVVKVSLQEKLKYIRRLLTLARTAQAYADRPQVIGYARKTVRLEKKWLRRASLPLTEADANELSELTDEFEELLARLKEATGKVDRYKRAQEYLDNFCAKMVANVEQISLALNPPPSPADPEPSQAEKFFTEGKEALRKVGDTIESGAQKLGNFVSQGVEKLKNAMTKDDNSK